MTADLKTDMYREGRKTDGRPEDRYVPRRKKKWTANLKTDNTENGGGDLYQKARRHGRRED